MSRKHIIALLLSVAIAGLVALWLQGVRGSRNNFIDRQKMVSLEVPTNDGSGCSDEYKPVCGIDGVTYDNECFALNVGIAIAALGGCSRTTALTDDERKYLLWLLRRRADADLPEVLMRHERTEQGICKECYDIFYRWGDPAVLVRVFVRGGAVAAAVDESGYDYLKNEQGDSSAFYTIVEE